MTPTIAQKPTIATRTHGNFFFEKRTSQIAEMTLQLCHHTNIFDGKMSIVPSDHLVGGQY